MKALTRAELRRLADFAAVVCPIQKIPTGLRGDRQTHDDAIEDYLAEKRRARKAAAIGAFYREYYVNAAEEFDPEETDHLPADILNPVPRPKRVRVSDDWTQDDAIVNLRYQHLGLNDDAVPMHGDRRIMGGHR